MKKFKKGFTLVELLVVIAILAILATVGIISYTSFIKDANKSNDETVCVQLNNILQADEVLHGKPKNFTEVVMLVQDNGFLVLNLNPSSDDAVFVWESNTNQFILVDSKTMEVIYTNRSLADKTPGKNWYVITHDQDIADKFVACTVTYLSGDAGLVADENVSNAIANAKNGDYIVLTGNVTLPSTSIDKNLTFVSVDASAVIEKDSLFVGANNTVTFKNVTFESAENASKSASSIYGSGSKGTIVLEGCTFTNPQWEAVQITPVDGAEIIIKNCTFIITADSEFTYYDGVTYKGCERMLHIQATKNANCNAKVTIVNNTFIGVDKVHNSVIDVDYIAFANITAYGNKFYKMDGTASNALTAGEIYVCDTTGAAMNYTEAYNKFTASK